LPHPLPLRRRSPVESKIAFKLYLSLKNDYQVAEQTITSLFTPSCLLPVYFTRIVGSPKSIQVLQISASVTASTRDASIGKPLAACFNLVSQAHP
jgi:hypothetical protein